MRSGRAGRIQLFHLLRRNRLARVRRERLLPRGKWRRWNIRRFAWRLGQQASMEREEADELRPYQSKERTTWLM